MKNHYRLNIDFITGEIFYSSESGLSRSIKLDYNVISDNVAFMDNFTGSDAYMIGTFQAARSMGKCIVSVKEKTYKYYTLISINVGGIVFSLVYLCSDMMTDVYGIERTKQMMLFVIFINLLFVFDVWITNSLSTNQNSEFSKILHNQARMFFSSAIAFFLGGTINSSVISLLKSRQRKRGIGLKKELLTTVWIRVATSSSLGIIWDVSLFSFFAFYGVVPSDKLANIIVFEDVYKISYELP